MTDPYREALEKSIAAGPLPAGQMMTAVDLAAFFEVTVGTVYVWASRGHLHRRAGRYDWREAALWVETRHPEKVTRLLVACARQAPFTVSPRRVQAVYRITATRDPRPAARSWRGTPRARAV